MVDDPFLQLWLKGMDVQLDEFQRKTIEDFMSYTKPKLDLARNTGLSSEDHLADSLKYAMNYMSRGRDKSQTMQLYSQTLGWDLAKIPTSQENEPDPSTPSFEDSVAHHINVFERIQGGRRTKALAKRAKDKANRKRARK